MTDAALQTAATTAHGAGFTVSIDRSSGSRSLVVTRDATGATYRAQFPTDSDDATWGMLLGSLKRNHAACEWVRVHGPWTVAKATAAGWPIVGNVAIATLPDNSTTIVQVTP